MKSEAKFYNDNYKYVRDVVFYRVTNHELADDITQDTFVNALIAIRDGRFNWDNERAWLSLIARNLIVDHYRKAGRNFRLAVDDNDKYIDVEDEDPNIQTEMEIERSVNDLVQLVELLPEDQKYTLKRIVLDDLAFSELNDEVDVSINTLLGRKRYALINLRKMIKKHKLTFTY